MKMSTSLACISLLLITAGAAASKADAATMSPRRAPRCSVGETSDSSSVNCEEATPEECCATGSVGTVCLLHYKKKSSE
jgi:hypothetical protein